MAREAERRSRGILDTVARLLGGDVSPEERLLRQRDGKRRRWRAHLNSYLMANAGFMLVNVLVATQTAVTVPWSLWAASLWGIGLGIHGLSYRGWLADNRKALHAAEIAVGHLPAPPVVLPSAEGIEIHDPGWQSLLERGERAAREALADLATRGDAARPAARQIEAGLRDLRRLAAGAERIRRAARAHDDDDPLRQLEDIEARLTRARDPALREALAANRAYLLERRARLDVLREDAERMEASAMGFVLAVDNLRLEVARLDAGVPSAAPGHLHGPVSKLEEEVNLLRQVEAELARR